LVGDSLIVDVRQVENNVRIRFDILHDGIVHSTGSCSRLSSIFNIEMRTTEGALMLSAKFDPVAHIKSWLPLKRLWGEVRNNVYNVKDAGGTITGRISRVRKGLFTSYHTVEWLSDMLRIYSISLGDTDYNSVYLGDTQIGMVVKHSYVRNNLDSYKLYLLDRFASYADIMSLYMLYFDNHYHGHRDEIVIVKHEKSWGWTFSSTNRFFKKHWLKDNFGLQDID
jgi:hypothetical protein